MNTHIILASVDWQIVESASTLVAAVASGLSVLFAWLTIREANSDARQTELHQKQAERNQQNRFQSSVMSACMQEYFMIRRDAAKGWKSTIDAVKEEARDVYGERMYGLHFEQYHLFRQEAIPHHVYVIWLKSLRDEITPPGGRSDPHYPPLSIAKYVGLDPKEDFNIFIKVILDASTPADKIEALVRQEAAKGSYK